LNVTVAADGPLIAPPTACPWCKSELEREEGRVVLLCPNRIGCPAQRLGAIEFFASRHQMNIDGLGEKVVAQLVEAGLVQDIGDLFSLTTLQLLTLDRFAKLSADNLIAAIAKAKQVATFSRLLSALGITNVGSTLAKPIAAKYRKLSTLREAAAAKSSEDFVAELNEIEGIGETIAMHVDKFLREPHVQVVLDKLAGHGLDPEEPVTVVGEGPLTGKTLVVTGTLMRPRADVQKSIEVAGGKVAGSVSKKTTYLVAGADTGKTKLEAAEKHGVQVISEQELEALISG
jgi:DNA ligase (NAD+)